MPHPEQNFANHARTIPAFHRFALPVLMINVGVTIGVLIREPNIATVWGVVVAAAMAVGVLYGRVQALGAQDRVIRLEETMRLQRLLPVEQHGEISHLSRTDFVGLRFASDEELPELFRRVRNGEFPNAKAIKRAVKQWRPDHLRV